MIYTSWLSKTSAVTFIAAVAALASAAASARRAPHILLILVDDLGFNDVSFHGSEVKTPVMDDLAHSGVIFDRYYGHSICTPSRASLHTGRFASHTGLQHSWIDYGQDVALPEKFTTLAGALKAGGYATAAAGKWHLGFTTLADTPTQRGFDSFLGYLGGGEDYYTHVSSGFPDMRQHAAPALEYRGDYSAPLFVNETIRSIRAHSAKVAAAAAAGDAATAAQPLFAYLALQSVHAPIEAPPAGCSPFNYTPADIPNPKRRTMAAMASCMDAQVGRVLEALKDEGMYDNTLIWVAADNGGPPYVANSNWPMRGGKWTMWEGGTHLAAFVHHGGGILPRNATFSPLVHHCDVMPTLLEAAGVAFNDTAQPPPDGVSQWSALRQLGLGLAARAPEPPPRTHVLLNVDQTNNSPKDCPCCSDPTGWSGYAGVVSTDNGEYLKLVLGYPGVPDSWCWPNTNATGVFGDGDALRNPAVRSGGALPPANETTCAFNGNVPQGGMIDVPILFDLAADPQETTDVASQRPADVARLRAVLDRYVASAVPPLNGCPAQRTRDPAALPAAQHAGAWVPWKPN